MKELSSEKKLKHAQDMWKVLFATIVDFLMSENPELLQEFFIKQLPENFTSYQLGNIAKFGSKIVGSLSKDILLKMVVDRMTQNMQFMQPGKNMNIDSMKNKVIINIPKCTSKKELMKTAKKCKIDLSKDELCKFWCEPICGKTISSFGLEYSREKLEDGCIITIQV